MDAVGEGFAMDFRKWIGGLVLSLLIIIPGLGVSQELADLDYDKLSFRGVGIELSLIHI